MQVSTMPTTGLTIQAAVSPENPVAVASAEPRTRDFGSVVGALMARLPPAYGRRSHEGWHATSRTYKR
jgi:hypothetical protein